MRTRVVCASLVACAVAAAGAAAGPPSASAGGHERTTAVHSRHAAPARPRFFGYSAIFSHTHTFASVVREMKAGGADTTRVFIPWSRVEPRQGQSYHFHFFDRVYERLLARGLRPVIVPINAPCWAHPSVPCDGAYNAIRPDRRYLGAWRRFMTKLAHRYRKARGFEIWNEPNLFGFWGPDPSPKHYVRLLRAAAAGVRAVKHHPPIAFGGPSGWGKWHGFIRHAYQRGAGRYSDDIALHLYPRHYPVTTSVVQQGRAAGAIVRKYDPSAGLWVTEVGVSTAKRPTRQPRVDPVRQAKALVSIYHRLARQGVKLLTIFRLRDPPAGQFPRESWQTGLGVEHRNGKPKPAFCALTLAVRAALPKGCSGGRHRH